MARMYFDKLQAPLEPLAQSLPEDVDLVVMARATAAGDADRTYLVQADLL